MAGFVWNVLLNSIGMSVICGVWLSGNTVRYRKYRAEWRYAGWIILFAGFLIPLLPGWNIFPAFFPTYQVEHHSWLAEIAADGSPARTGVSLKVPAEWKSAGNVLAYLWFLGAAAAAGKLFFDQINFRRQAARLSRSETEEEVLQCAEKIRVGLGIRSGVLIRRLPGIYAPVLTGLFYPVISLPERGYTDKEMEMMLRHELTHFKRRDLWIQLLLRLCQVVHWFNPFLPLFVRAVERECEMSCDLRTMENANEEERKAYCRLLLRSAGKSDLNPAYAAGLSGSGEELKRRMEEILGQTGKKRGLVPVFLAGIVICLLGSIRVSEAASRQEYSDLQEPFMTVYSYSYGEEEGTAVEYVYPDE